MKTIASCVAASVLGLALVSSAQAITTVTGQISADLILTNSCLVDGAAGSSGLDFGSLSFGTTTSLFTEATGQVLGGGGGALSVLCSNGTSPSITVNAGSNDGQGSGGTRALFDGGTHYVGYDLFTDASFSTLLAIGGVINLGASTGVAQTVNIYGKAVGAAGLPAGTYTDTVAVQLSF